jgi:hypothetical protein
MVEGSPRWRRGTAAQEAAFAAAEAAVAAAESPTALADRSELDARQVRARGRRPALLARRSHCPAPSLPGNRRGPAQVACTDTLVWCSTQQPAMRNLSSRMRRGAEHSSCLGAAAERQSGGNQQDHAECFASEHMRPTAAAFFSSDSAGARAAQLRAVAAVLAAMISAYRGPGEGDSSPLYSLHPGVLGSAGLAAAEHGDDAGAGDGAGGGGGAGGRSERERPAAGHHVADAPTLL